MDVYRNSLVMKKLSQQQVDRNPELKYEYVLKIHSGQSLGSPEDFHKDWNLTHHFAEGIDDKLNTIEFINQEVKADFEQVVDIIAATNPPHIDLGRLHWKLLVDVESLLMHCRSALDLFARLTKCLYVQILDRELPDSFTDQVTKHKKHADVDSEYFNYISQLRWFDKLKEYRDDLAHKTSLKITIKPVPNETFPIRLETKRKTLIRFEDIAEIISGMKDFASYYVTHFSNVLKAYSTG